MPRISHSWIRRVYQHSSVQDTHERCWNAWQGAGQFFHIPQPSLGHFTGSIFPLSMAYLQPHYMHTHVHTCRAHTSLPDASPPERGIPDYGLSTVAAQVNSQASVSLSRSFPSFPPAKGALHPQASSLQAGPQDCSGKGCYQDPHMARAMVWPPALLVS